MMIDFIRCTEMQLQCQSDAGIRCKELKESTFHKKWNIKFKVNNSFIYKTVHFREARESQ